MSTFGPMMTSLSWQLHRGVAWLAGSVTLGVWLTAVPPAATAQQQGGELQSVMESLLRQIGGELGRVQTYLTYYDQIHRLSVTEGRMSSGDADGRLTQKAHELLRTSYQDSELGPLLDQHREMTRAYFQRIEQAVASARVWPDAAPAESYRARARGELERLWREYDELLAQKLDPLPALENASRVLGWTMGHAEPPASLNPFAGQRERLAGVIPRVPLEGMRVETVPARPPVSRNEPGAAPAPSPAQPSVVGATRTPSQARARAEPPAAEPGPTRATETYAPPASGADSTPTLDPVPHGPSVGAAAGTPAQAGRTEPKTEPGPARETQPPKPPEISEQAPVSRAGEAGFSPPQPGEDEHALWRRVYAADTREAYDRYLQLFPNGRYGSLARLGRSTAKPGSVSVPEPTRPTSTPAPSTTVPPRDPSAAGEGGGPASVATAPGAAPTDNVGPISGSPLERRPAAQHSEPSASSPPGPDAGTSDRAPGEPRRSAPVSGPERERGARQPGVATSVAPPISQRSPVPPVPSAPAAPEPSVGPPPSRSGTAAADSQSSHEKRTAAAVSSRDRDGAPGPGARRGGRLDRAEALLNQGEFEEALAAYDEALRADPSSADAQLGRGRALNALGDVAGAIEAYQAVLRVRPDRPHLRAWLAELWLAGGDVGRAQGALQEELRLFPSSAWARSYEGTLHLLGARHADAERAMAEAVRLDPAVVQQRWANGVALADSGQHHRAVVEYSSVLAMDPNMIQAYFALGQSLEELGQTAPAIQAFEAYLQRDPTSQMAEAVRDELVRLHGRAPRPSAPVQKGR